MKSPKVTKSLVPSLLFCMCLTQLAAGETKLLWQIGKADNNTAEFALGPDRSNLYSVTFPRDALFVAGQSDPKQDWPYIQPGPADVWAGSKSHIFTILFGVKTAPTAGQANRSVPGALSLGNKALGRGITVGGNVEIDSSFSPVMISSAAIGGSIFQTKSQGSLFVTDTSSAAIWLLVCRTCLVPMLEFQTYRCRDSFKP